MSEQVARHPRPGSWIAIPMRRRHLIYGERDEPIFPDGLWYILPESNPEQCPIAIIDRANDHDAPTRAEAENVARLIAAAPDLLRACMAWAERGWCAGPKPNPGCACDWHMAKAAIAKAQVEQSE